MDPNITESVRDLVVRALEKGESHDSYGENVTDGRSGILLIQFENHQIIS